MTETRPQPKLPRVPPAKQGRVKQRQCGLSACRKSSQEQSLEAVGLCLLHAAWTDLLSLGPGASVPTCLNSPPTGKPDAGNPPVRFGGRGGTTVPSLPLSGERSAPPLDALSASNIRFGGRILYYKRLRLRVR